MDRDLVEQARRGDREAFTVLVHQVPDGTFYRNGVADEMLLVHEGSGVCDTIFGPLRYGPGDYLVVPIAA